MKRNKTTLMILGGVALILLWQLGAFTTADSNPTETVRAAQLSVDQPAGTLTPKDCVMANGLAYGPFRDGQSPGTNRSRAAYPSREQIQEDLKFLSRITRRIRIYGTESTFADIPRLAKPLGISVMQGIYLSKDKVANENAINAALQLAREGLIGSIIVGNEELTGSLISKQELLEYIQRVKKAAPPEIRVSTAEVWGVWQEHLDLAANVDFVVAHFYPFWEELPVSGAAAKLLEQYNALRTSLQNRYPERNLEVVIGETGWASGLHSPRPSVKPSPESQKQFVKDFLRIACDNSIPFYFFEAFDEEWKWEEGGSSSIGSALNRPGFTGGELI